MRVAENTIRRAVQSPPNKAQNDALANPTKNSVQSGSILGRAMIFSYFSHRVSRGR